MSRLLVSALSGVLCLLSASQSAFAGSDDLDHHDMVLSEQEAILDAARGELRGLNCETVRLEDGSWEAQCDDPADESVAACGDWVDSTYNLDQAGMTAMYEACMTIALHTPGAVH